MRIKSSFALCCLCGLWALASCEMDAYEKGEGDYSLLTAELVEAHVDATKHVDYVETDQSERLQLQEPYTASWLLTADTTYRAILYFNRLADAQAQAVSMSRVGVLLPRDTVKGGLKTDPLYVDGMWLSKNRKYLNLRLRLLTGATDDAEAMHTIGILRDTIASTSSHLRLLLYHNQGGRPEYYSSSVIASIPLTDVHADTLTLQANSYAGQLSRTFSLRSNKEIVQ